jgi:hypothetical protein
VLLKSEISDNIKEMCLDVIFTVSEHKRALLTKNPTLLKQVIDTVFTMVVENKKNQGIIFILR